jgi:hypothetical protein
MLMHGERSARREPKFQTWRNNRAEPVSQDVSTMRPGPVLGQSDASSVHNVKVHSKSTAAARIRKPVISSAPADL